MKTNLFLIGPMGTGKSTVGLALSRLMGMPFFDSDREIEAKTGVSIPWIFEVEGEEGFRKREEIIIEELTERENIIVATGGGTVLSDKNCSLLKSRGTIIYLTTSLEQQVMRVKKNRNRPLVYSEQLDKTLTSLNQIRLPIYENLADHVFITDGLTTKALAQQICNRVRK